MMCLSSCSDCAARAVCAWRDGWFSQRGIGSHMIEPKNPILSKMLDRLFVTLMDGPSMNCKPHASRQRLDFVQIERLKDKSAGEIFLSVLREGEAKLTARVPIPSRAPHTAETSK